MSRHHYKYSTREILIDLRRVYREVGREQFSYPAYDQQGRFSASLMAKRFGSWIGACRAIGVTPVRQHPYWRIKLHRQRELSVTRPCLKCDEPFKSWDQKKNRICPLCTLANDGILDAEPYRVAM